MPTFHTILLGFWLIFLVFWGATSIKAKRTIGRQYGEWGIRIRIITFITALILLASGIIPRSTLLNSIEDPIIGTIGVILAGLGTAIAIWARLNLGRNWGMPMSLKENPELVTSGPYHYIRHPIYTGVLLAVLGSTLISGLLWLIVFIMVAINFIYSAKQEEKIMLKQFPDQYPQYMKRTKMLIPFIF